MRYKRFYDGDLPHFSDDRIIKVKGWRGVLLLNLLDDVPTVHTVAAVDIANGRACIISEIVWAIRVVRRKSASKVRISGHLGLLKTACYLQAFECRH